MELRHLRYFVVTAEELHFTRAAERLGIKQPPLSQQIRQLESEIGSPLFRRLSRRVELTESGRVLLEGARAVLDHVERVKAAAQRSARGETGRIVLGLAGSTDFQPLVPRIVRTYRERYPDLLILPEQTYSPQLLINLQRGLIDVAFIRLPLAKTRGIKIDTLIEEPIVAVLPRSHALAGEASVTLEQLAEEAFVLPPRAIAPNIHEALIASCERVGFRPRVREEASHLVSVATMVAAGFGISVVPNSLRRINVDLVAYKPLRGEVPRSSIGIAHRSEGASPAVRNFVALARRIARHGGEDSDRRIQ